VQLQWATYFDAADQAGISRIYGGIHPGADDGPGRVIGSKVGKGAFREAMAYLDGTVLEDFKVEISHSGTTARVSWRSLSGHQYKVQWAATLEDSAFQNLTDFQAFPPGEASSVDNTATADARFYRVVRIANP
jgi:hypothetical protein